MKLLVVDDEKEIADLVELYLLNEGYEVYKAYDAKHALRIIQTKDLDLAILDVMLPDMDGFELCRRIRKKHHYPVIMLTAKIEDIDKITGLSIGADDYMTKPFNPLELVARVKAHLRRYTQYNNEEEKQILDLRGLSINRLTHKCMLYEKPLELTPLEFSILTYLVEHAGRAVSFQELFENVWQEAYYESNNTIMVHMRRLREKMGETPRNPKFIKTVWGVGYTIEKE